VQHQVALMDGSSARGAGTIAAAAATRRVARVLRSTSKGESKVRALRLLVAAMDLTTLEGRDTPEHVHRLALRARRPAPDDTSIGPCAAVCVYPSLVACARRALEGSSVRVASVATAFPAGQVPLALRLADVQFALDEGADEIDMVIDRGAWLAGNESRVFDEIAAVRERCAARTLKVIVESGELGSLDNVRRAGEIALAAGADFLKTSTGKVQPAATLPVTLVLAQAIADHQASTGRLAGFKAAGGIRAAKQAIGYLRVVEDVLGSSALAPHRFRIGASTLLHDVLLQLEKERIGHYPAESAIAR